MTQQDFTTGTKVYLAAGTALCIIGLVDFIYIGHHAYDLISAAGAALMVCATYKIGSWNLIGSNSEAPTSHIAHYARAIGMLLLVGSPIASHLM